MGWIDPSLKVATTDQSKKRWNCDKPEVYSQSLSLIIHNLKLWYYEFQAEIPKYWRELQDNDTV